MAYFFYPLESCIILHQLCGKDINCPVPKSGICQLFSPGFRAVKRFLKDLIKRAYSYTYLLENFFSALKVLRDTEWLYAYTWMMFDKLSDLLYE